jgi:hypothetical protein
LDDLIDRALTSYGQREAQAECAALPGLEQRILAAVAEEGRSAAQAGRWPERAGRPEFVARWMRLLEGRFARLAIAAMLLLAVAAVPVRLLMHHREAMVARLAAGAGARPALSAVPMRLAPANGEDATAHLRTVSGQPVRNKLAVAGPEELRPTHKARQDHEPGSEASIAFAPIEWKPITIAPIRIGELN